MLLPYSLKYSAHFLNVVPKNFNKSFTNKIIVKLRCSLFSVSAQFSIKQISLAYGPLQSQRKIGRSEKFFWGNGLCGKCTHLADQNLQVRVGLRQLSVEVFGAHEDVVVRPQPKSKIENRGQVFTIKCFCCKARIPN